MQHLVSEPRVQYAIVLGIGLIMGLGKPKRKWNGPKDDDPGEPDGGDVSPKRPFEEAIHAFENGPLKSRRNLRSRSPRNS